MPKRGSHTVLILPDAHFPFIDQLAWSTAMAAGRKLKPQRTVLLGDLINGTPFSRHAVRELKEIARRDFKTFEIDPANAALDEIEGFTKGEIAITAGNHDAWPERAAAQLGKELASVFPLFDPAHLLTGHRKRVKWIKYGRDVSLPGYHYEITPDFWAFHEVTHARNAVSKTLDALPTVSSVFGHVHRVQSEARSVMVGNDRRVVESFTPGCLCELSPRFMGGKPSTWVHAIGVAYVKNDLSSFDMHTCKIVGGRCILPDGSQVRG